VCEPECPVDAIEPMDSGELVDFNREWSLKWPNITKQQDPLPEHEKYKNESDKIKKYFKGK
jgi:ferredoxin